MVRISIALTYLLIVYGFPTLLARPRPMIELPDLTIKQYEFASSNDKSLRVLIANEGKSASTACRIELAIRKVNGTAVTRTAFETVPALRPGKEEWVTINANGILQAAYSLKDTTFKLTVDETDVVTESNEGNNVTWHNSN